MFIELIKESSYYEFYYNWNLNGYIFEILGNNGKICAVISAWLGNVVLTFPIVYFFRKSI